MEIIDVDDLGEIAESRRVFVVRIEHDDVSLGMTGEDRGQDQRNAARFSGTGRADDGEMLCQQLVHYCERLARRIMKKGADTDICDRGPSVNRPEIGIRRVSNGSTRYRVMRNPASEFAVTLGRSYDFAQQVDDENAARRRTAIDLYSTDCSHHLVIDAPGLDHRANADRAREGLISLHRHLRARYGRYTPETIHQRLFYLSGVPSYSPSNTSTSSSRSAASPRGPRLRRSIATVLITAKTSHPGT